RSCARTAPPFMCTRPVSRPTPRSRRTAWWVGRPRRPEPRRMSMTTPPPTLIAGGGIGGLALALALAQRAGNSIVLEQRDTFATAGGGIQLGHNGVRVPQPLRLA